MADEDRENKLIEVIKEVRVCRRSFSDLQTAFRNACSVIDKKLSGLEKDLTDLQQPVKEVHDFATALAQVPPVSSGDPAFDKGNPPAIAGITDATNSKS